jgi:GTP-binding protein
MDSIDSLLVRDGREMVLIDTAGMRKKARVGKSGIEGLSVIHAIRSMERSDAVVLMIDGAEGAGEQDAKIAGLAEERGLALVIALNKMDRLAEADRKKAARRTREILSFVAWAELVQLSVKTGRGVQKLMSAVDAALAEREKRVTTGELNRFFEEVIERHPPPTMKNRAPRLFYFTQASVHPPTFVAVCSHPQAIHFSYERYVQNQIRERFGFEGTPIRVRYRPRRRDER